MLALIAVSDGHHASGTLLRANASGRHQQVDPHRRARVCASQNTRISAVESAIEVPLGDT
jgi:hypothetical protein